MAPNLRPPTNENVLEGLFRFLDATLGDEILGRFQAEGAPDETPYHSAVGVTRDWIERCFELGSLSHPLRAWAAPFGIWFRHDVTDAFARAHAPHRLGRDPRAAFLKDYTPTDAIITFADPNEAWAHRFGRSVAGLRRDGDRIVHYSTPPSIGFMLLRGTHRVAEAETLHLTLGAGGDPGWAAAKNHYDALGGVQGYLRGAFIWPDPNWRNPAA